MPTPEEEAATRAAEEAAKAENEAKAKAEAEKNQEKKFTQLEVNAIIAERLKREEEKATKEKEAERLRIEKETAEKNGEWQKLAETNKAEAEKAKQEAAAATAEAQAVRIETAVLLDAGKAQFGAKSDQRFADPELAHKLIKADGLPVTVEDGKVKGSLEALKELAKKYPYMLETAQQQQRVTTPSFGKQPTQNTPVQRPAQRTRY